MISGKSQWVKMHKNRAENLCILPIDKDSARHNRQRAAEKTKKGAI
jgi:hypothetical protein